MTEEPTENAHQPALDVSAFLLLCIIEIYWLYRILSCMKVLKQAQTSSILPSLDGSGFKNRLVKSSNNRTLSCNVVFHNRLIYKKQQLRIPCYPHNGKTCGNRSQPRLGVRLPYLASSFYRHRACIRLHDTCIFRTQDLNFTCSYVLVKTSAKRGTSLLRNFYRDPLRP